MGENMQTALMLMAVGMTTVFVILFLLVTFSKILIRIVNRYIPEVIQETAKTSRNVPTIPSGKLAVIVASIEAITGGTGRIEKIEKKNNTKNT